MFVLNPLITGPIKAFLERECSWVGGKKIRYNSLHFHKRWVKDILKLSGT